jgi:hypothetical protein
MVAPLPVSRSVSATAIAFAWAGSRPAGATVMARFPAYGCGRSTASSRSMSSRAIWARKPGFCSISALNDEVRSNSRSLSRTARTVADRIRSLSSAISPMTAPRPRSCSTRSPTVTRSRPLSST